MIQQCLGHRLAILSACLCAVGLTVACSPSAHNDAAYERASNAFDAGRFDLARLAIDEAVAADGSRPEVLLLAADAWSSGTLQSPSRAVDFFRSYLVLRPDAALRPDDAVRLRLAQALFTLGRWPEAAAEAARIDADGTALQLRARALAETDPEAARLLLPEIRRRGGAPGAHGTAAFLLDRFGEPDEALAAARLAVDENPLDRASLYLLGRLLRRHGDLAAAKKALELHQALSRLAADGSAGQLSDPEAVELLAEIEPGLPTLTVDFRLERLRRWLAVGQRRQAAEELALLSQLEVSMNAAMELAGLAERAGRRRLARRFLERVLAQLPASSAGGVMWRRAVYGLALLEYRNGNHQEVRELLLSGLEAAPSSALFHHLSGRVELAQDREEQALGSYRRALKLAPWNVDCRLDLANLLLARGQLDEALRHVREAPEEHGELRRFAARHAAQ